MSSPRQALAAALAATAAAFAAPIRAAETPPTQPVLVLGRDLAARDFDDPAWNDAAAIVSTIQQEPVEGAPASLATECRIIATPRALLLRFVLEEPPAEIVAHELRRDADLSADDRIAFVLDTYHDRRNAYYFATNANGVRVDGLVIEQSAASLDWDTVWDVRVRRTALGWDALFRIPFASLSFRGEDAGVWGFNFSRQSHRRAEIARWTGWQRPYPLELVSLAGDLTGLPPLASRRLRQAIPFAAGAFDRRSNPSDTDAIGKAGFDVRYGLTSAVEADLTVNTDFAETEADQQQFNFGRSSLFFPEKRAFFLERSQVFAFGDPDTTLPFFSRRIGFDDDGNALPIDAGLKLTGRVGPTDLGMLAVQTRAAAGQPRTDFLVARLKQDLGHSTYVGGLFTNVEQPAEGGVSRDWRTYGVDTRIQLHPDWRFIGYWVDTHTPGVSGRTSAWSADLFYNGRNAKGEIQAAHFGSAYEPRAGFVRQPGVQLYFADLTLIARPAILGLQDINVEAFTFPRYTEDGSLSERETQYTFRANWRNGAYMDDDLVDAYDERLTEPLDLAGHATIAPGSYHFVRHQIAFGTDPSRALAFQANFNFGGYYDGRRDRYIGRVFWKPSEHVAVTAIEDYNVVRLAGGDFDLSLFSLRLDWNPSVSLLTSFTLQSDNLDRLTHAQAIVRWLVDPATDVFAVYDRQTGAGFERPGTRVTVKVRRTFDF